MVASAGTMFNGLNQLLSKNKIKTEGSVVFTDDGFSLNVLYNSKKYSLKIRKADKNPSSAKVNYNFTVECQGQVQVKTGVVSSVGEWVLDEEQNNIVVNTILNFDATDSTVSATVQLLLGNAYDKTMIIILPIITALNVLQRLKLADVDTVTCDAFRETVVYLILLAGTNAKVIENDKMRRRFMCGMLGHIMTKFWKNVKSLFDSRDDIVNAMRQYGCTLLRVKEAQIGGSRFKTKQNVIDIANERDEVEIVQDLFTEKIEEIKSKAFLVGRQTVFKSEEDMVIGVHPVILSVLISKEFLVLSDAEKTAVLSYAREKIHAVYLILHDESMVRKGVDSEWQKYERRVYDVLDTILYQLWMCKTDVDRIKVIEEKTESMTRRQKKTSVSADNNPVALLFDKTMRTVQPQIDSLNGSETNGSSPRQSYAEYIHNCIVKIIIVIAEKSIGMKNEDQQERFICAVFGHVYFHFNDEIKSILFGDRDLPGVLARICNTFKYRSDALNSGSLFATKEKVISMIEKWD